MQPDAIDPRAYARRWKTLGVLSLSLLIIGLDNTVLNVALPTLQTHFSASASTLQWIVDAYLLSFAGVLLTMGTLGDRFGRRLALQSGLVLFVGGLLLEWFSWSSVFWLNVPIVGFALVAGFRLVPESRDPRPGAFDLRGAGLSVATLVTLVYGIIEA